MLTQTEQVEPATSRHQFHKLRKLPTQQIQGNHLDWFWLWGSPPLWLWVSPSCVNLDHSSVMFGPLRGKVSNLMGFVIRLTARAQAEDQLLWVPIAYGSYGNGLVKMVGVSPKFQYNFCQNGKIFKLFVAITDRPTTEMPQAARLVKATMRLQVTSQSLCPRQGGRVKLWHPVDSNAAVGSLSCYLWVLVKRADG